MAYFIGYAGVIFAVTVILTIVLGNENAVPLVLISGILVFMLAFGPVFFNEQYEEKHRAYDFLDILPISAGEIVLAKFGLVLLTVTLTAGYILMIFSLFKVAPNDWVLVRSYILMGGAVSLIFSAISYIGIFGLGYTKFAMIVMSLFVLMGFVPIFIMKFYRDNMNVLVENIFTFFRSINWMVVAPFVLIVYFALMFIAVKVKSS